MRTRLLASLALLLLACGGSGPSTPARVAASTAAALAPPQSSAFGQPLSRWLHDYFAWYLTGLGPGEGAARVVYLQYPTDCTPELSCSLWMTARPGTAFFVPVAAWIGERYLPETGIPDDVLWPRDVFFDQVWMTAQVDGEPVLDLRSRYAEAWYDPPLLYPEPRASGSYAAIFVQGVGFIVNPLPIGTHQVHVLNYWPMYNLLLEYDWHIEVSN